MDAPWRIELLGWLRATQRERVVTRFRSQKTGALLAYLAYHAHRSQPREALIELHWPECDPEVGRQRLRTALTSLRHQLEPPGVPAGAVILADSAAVQLNPAACGTDVAQFEARLQAAAASTGAERVQRLTDAVALYRGELLPGYYESWILPEREWLAERFSQALGELIALAEQAGDLPLALQWARRAVSADPLREAGHRDLIRLLAAAGEQDAALRQYDELARRLDAELGAEPEEETRALVRSLHSPPGDARRQTAAIRQPVASRAASETNHSSAPISSPRSAAPQPSPLSLPTGTVTFVLAEMTGAAALRQRGEAAFAAARESYQELLRPLFRGHGGHELDAAGEVLRVAFGRASDALAAAVAGQRAMAAHPRPADSGPRAMRMALHTGEVEPGEEVRGCPVLAHATRLLLAAHGGQILLSAESAALIERDRAPGVDLADLGLYRLREEAPPERLFQVCFPEMRPRAFPAPNAPPGHSGHLPLPFTRFFGRQEEIAQLGALLAEATRLVTLTGPGGSGKTRLALETARRQVAAGHGAAWFVPLADLVDPRLIADAVRDALGLPRAPGVDPLEQAMAALSREPTLLLLDNVEHLLPEGADLVHTLRERVPTLTCLVTSRQRLGLAGEREFLVPPLGIPEARDPPERLIRCESVELFVDRAQGVCADFQVTRGNAAAVAALCRRLEGIPLALELAAARARVLTPGQMLARLEDRYEFLVSRRREGEARHRSLRAAIEWSYQLLAPELQRFFARLHVFRGGWSLGAAETVCGEVRALDYLEELGECSLVQTQEGPGEMRFRLLETLREYGREQLNPAERTALQQRHLQYYLALAEQAGPELPGEHQRAWLERLEREHDNLRAALAWSGAQGQSEAGLRLGAALWRFWRVRGYWTEGREHLAGLLGLPGAEARTAARAQALHGAGMLTWRQGDYEGAWALLEESLAISRELGDKPGIAASLGGLGVVAHEQGEYGAARALHEESLAISRKLGHKGEIARSLGDLGYVARTHGGYEAGQALYEESLAICRELGYNEGIAWSLGGLGWAAQAQGDYEAARALFVESLAIERGLGHKDGIAWSLHNLGYVAQAQGDYEAGQALYEESLAIFRELGNKSGIAWSLGGLGWAAQARGDYEAARALFVESLAIFRELGDKPRIARDLEGLAAVAVMEARSERAARLFGAAEGLREVVGAPLRPAERAEHDRSVAAARTALGEEAFAAAWAEGRALSLEQAIRDALEGASDA